jgi:NAD(P)H-hydrate epimerase
MTAGEMENQDDPPRLEARSPHSHKGTFGTALLIGGSRGMAGGVALAGMAALRGGAGLVRLAVPLACLDTVAGFEPAYMTSPLASDRAGRIALDAKAQIERLAASATAVGCGPGMGRSLGLDALVGRLYRMLRLPAIFDADALNALADRPEVLDQPGGPRILTPHPGEFARLIGKKLPQSEWHDAAAELAARSNAVIVLKKHDTLVTDGDRRFVNRTGNPGLATGGTGDVLTGLITALLCQGLDTLGAARLAVHLHGRAGDLAAGELGQESLISSDLLRFLPRAFVEYRQAKPRR